MKILFTTDLHFTDKADDLYRFRVFDAIEKHILYYDIDALFILGDLTESFDRHSGELINKVVDNFAFLASITNVYILRGNHDYSNPNYPTFKILRHIPNITYIDEPRTISFSEGLEVLMLPNSATPVSDWKEFDFSEFDFICMHQTVTGSKVSSGYTLEGLPMSLFDKAKKVYSGDIHNPQVVGKVTYIGAPYQTDMGDTYTPRLLLLDTSLDLETELPFETVKKHVLKLTSVEDLADWESKVDPEDQVAINYFLQLKDLEKWPVIQASIYQWAARLELNVKSLVCVMEQPELVKTNNQDPTLTSPVDILEDFVKTRHADLPKPYVEEGKHIIKEVDGL